MSFWCSVYRRTGCKAKLWVFPTEAGYAIVGRHTCRVEVTEETQMLDVAKDMKQMTDTLAISNLIMPAQQIWLEVSATFYPESDSIFRQGLSEEQVISRVYRIRRKHYGGHMLGVIEVPPLSMVENMNLSFFQFHVSRAKADPTKPPDRIIGWAHPILRELLMHNSVTLFVDGTFRCVPTEFEQCVIVMVHDRARELFVPAYYVLCTGKIGDMYFDIMEMIYRDTSEKLDPSEIVCNFELGLIRAAQKQFENAEIIGCLFHFKQAVHRHMKSLAIPDNEVSIAMQKGVLDMLTVLNPEHVPIQGICWVKVKIRELCSGAGIGYSASKWRQFWQYFRVTWTDLYNVEEWNVHGLGNELVARTNNPLERFHRELNKSFPSPHPNIVVFVTVIRKISQNYVTKLANVSAGRRKRNTKTNAKRKKSTQGKRGGEHIELPEPIDLSIYNEATIDSDSESDIANHDEVSSSSEGNSSVSASVDNDELTGQSDSDDAGSVVSSSNSQSGGEFPADLSFEPDAHDSDDAWGESDSSSDERSAVV